MTLAGFQHHILRSGEIDIHAVVGGAGPPLLLIHGFPQTWWEWRKMMPLLVKHRTIVAVDLRGAGHSDCPQGGYDKETLAKDVHGAMKHLGFETYAVCGHDIGGMVALALAATHRHAVTHLAIFDVPLPGWSRWGAIFSDPRVWTLLST